MSREKCFFPQLKDEFYKLVYDGNILDTVYNMYGKKTHDLNDSYIIVVVVIIIIHSYYRRNKIKAHTRAAFLFQSRWILLVYILFLYSLRVNTAKQRYPEIYYFR